MGNPIFFFVAIVNYIITLGFFFLFKCLWLNPRSGLLSRISQSILPICREASDFCVCHLHLSRCWHSGRVFIFKATHDSGIGHPPSPARNATGGNHHWPRATGLGSLRVCGLCPWASEFFFGIFPFLCMFTPVFNYHCWWDLHLSLLRAALTLELPPFLQLLRAARPGTWELVRKTFKWFLLLGKFRKPEQFLCIQMSHNHPMHSMIKTIVTRKATCPKNLHWVRQIHTYSDGTFFKKAHEVRNHWTATIAVRAHFADICGASFQEEGSSISSARQFIPTTCRMCLDV